MPRLRARTLAILVSAVTFGAWAMPSRGLAEEPAAPAADHPARESYPSLNVLGFGDANFFAESGASSPDTSFFQGQLVLHFTAALSPRWSFFGEMSVSPRREAATQGAAHAYAAEVERAIVKLTWKDPLKVAAGRFHAPHNYWNVAFHHGAWLQTTIARPEMIQFGGQFLPVHFVGVTIEGTVRPGAAALDYEAGIGNGRSTVISRGGDAGDVNDSRALLAALAVRPDRPFGLRVGGAVYRDLVTIASGDHREWIFAAHLASAREDPEVLAEYAVVRHRDPQHVSRSSHGYYVQLAWRLAAKGRRFKPYARWEQLRVADGDPVFDRLPDRRIVTAGLRFEGSDLVALKGEYRHHRSDPGGDADGLYAQISFTF